MGPGDYDLLCWARQPADGSGLPIRNFVLGEVTLNFVRFATEIFKYMDPPTTHLTFLLRLENMAVNGVPCTLSSERDNIKFPRPGVKKTAPDTSSIRAEFRTQFPNIDVGSVVYELLAQIYAFFGFNHNEMPYLEDDGTKRITAKSMFISMDAGE